MYMFWNSEKCEDAQEDVASVAITVAQACLHLVTLPATRGVTVSGCIGFP